MSEYCNVCREPMPEPESSLMKRYICEACQTPDANGEYARIPEEFLSIPFPGKTVKEAQHIFGVTTVKSDAIERVREDLRAGLDAGYRVENLYEAQRAPPTLLQSVITLPVDVPQHPTSPYASKETARKGPHTMKAFVIGKELKYRKQLAQGLRIRVEFFVIEYPFEHVLDACQHLRGLGYRAKYDVIGQGKAVLRFHIADADETNVLTMDLTFHVES